MSDQQKRIVVISVLGALVLGTGGWYFFMKDTGPKIDYSQQGKGQRRVRSSDNDKKTRVTRRERKSATRTVAKSERKQRDRGPRKSSKRRTRRGHKGPDRVDKLQEVPRM